MLDLIFVPSVYIFESNIHYLTFMKLFRIIQKDVIDLKQESSYGVIVRIENEVHTYWISKENWVFIQRIISG